MNKYKTVNGKIRHAHAPVGTRQLIDVQPAQGWAGTQIGRSEVASWVVEESAGDIHCLTCGYHLCSCPPEPAPEWNTAEPYMKSLASRLDLVAELHELHLISHKEAFASLLPPDWTREENGTIYHTSGAWVKDFPEYWVWGWGGSPVEYCGPHQFKPTMLDAMDAALGVR